MAPAEWGRGQFSLLRHLKVLKKVQRLVLTLISKRMMWEYNIDLWKNYDVDFSTYGVTTRQQQYTIALAFHHEVF